MAVQTGNNTSLADSGRLVRSVEDGIPKIDPGQAPFLTDITGGKDLKPRLNDTPKFANNAISNKVEFYTQSLRKTQFTLAAAMTAVQGTLQVTPSSDAGHILLGMILEIDSEQVLVTGNGDPATGIVNIDSSRNYAGTNATHSSGATVYFRGRTHEESATVPKDNYLTPDQDYNFYQGYIEEFETSFVGKFVQRFGQKDWVAEQEETKLMLAAKSVEFQGIYGLRAAATATRAGAMGGLRQFLPSVSGYNVNKSGVALTRADINAFLRTQLVTAGQGALADTMMVSPTAAELVNTLVTQSNFVMVTQDRGSETGGIRIRNIDTQHGSLRMFTNPNLVGNDIWFYRKEGKPISIFPLRGGGESLGFKLYKNPSTKTTEDYYIYGVYSMLVSNPYTIGRIYNFT